MHQAVSDSNEEMVALLFENGARADLINSYGKTPFHIAADLKNRGIIETFIAHGVSLEIKNKEGKTVYETLDGETKKFVDQLATKYKKSKN